MEKAQNHSQLKLAQSANSSSKNQAKASSPSKAGTIRTTKSAGEPLYWTRGTLKTTELSVGDVLVKAKTDATPSNLKLVRDLVNERFEQFSDRIKKGISAHQLMVLVAFNLAEELLIEKERNKFLKKKVVECTDKLLDRVESYLES